MDELNAAVNGYRQKWQQFMAARKDKAFFEELQPTAICLKLADMTEIDKRVAELREHADHIHWGWINERWLVTIHLREQQLPWGIEIVKLYQRRPGSADHLGVDHVDFYAPLVDEDILADEPELKWSHEQNGEQCKWISIWFDGTEAKLRNNTTLDVCATELAELDKQITTKEK